jgi:hypothetical protein
MLDFQQLDHALALRLLHAMKSAVTNVLASDASVADSDETSRMYKESITELAQMMR